MLRSRHRRRSRCTTPDVDNMAVGCSLVRLCGSFLSFKEKHHAFLRWWWLSSPSSHLSSLSSCDQWNRTPATRSTEQTQGLKMKEWSWSCRWTLFTTGTWRQGMRGRLFRHCGGSLLDSGLSPALFLPHVLFFLPVIVSCSRTWMFYLQ